jgi:hypothetical protein
MPPAPKLQPALWGGVFIGVLSSLPVVGWLNACCCLWVVAGGALAIWLSQANHPYSLTAADGALIGLLAGAVGGLVAIPLNLIFEQSQRDLVLRLLHTLEAEVPPQFEAILESRASVLARVVSGLFSAVIYAIFAMLGGLLGVALFKRSEPPPPPPPGTVEILPPE